jgi:phage head maturation protease
MSMAMTVEKRLLGLTPASYNAQERTVTAVLSRGSPVARFYGTETLRISRSAINLRRVSENQVPILDSHQQIGLCNNLGVVRAAWIENDEQGAALLGKLQFGDTPEGRRAEGCVARHELNGISCGYRVETFELRDRDGRLIDPEIDRDAWRDENLQWEAVRWELLEISLCSVPADAGVGFRSDRALPASVGRHLDVLARMKSRQAAYEQKALSTIVRRECIQRMKSRQAMHDRASARSRSAAAARAHERQISNA